MACGTGQIKFYRKNHIDLDRPNPVLSVVDAAATNDGTNALKYLRNRNNNSGWSTTDSLDANNTQLLFNLGDMQQIDTIILVKHNFKNFLVERRNITLDIFETVEQVVDNEDTTKFISTDTYTDQIRITITGTIVADSDKRMTQMIIAENFGVGTLESFPVITAPTTSVNKKSSKLLGGRSNIIETRGSFSATLNVRFLNIDADLTLIENIFLNREGVLMLLSGSNDDQFASRRVGYRNEDIVLVRPVNELQLPYGNGIYINGIKIVMKMQEVIF